MDPWIETSLPPKWYEVGRNGGSKKSNNPTFSHKGTPWIKYKRDRFNSHIKSTKASVAITKAVGIFYILVWCDNNTVCCRYQILNPSSSNFSHKKCFANAMML